MDPMDAMLLVSLVKPSGPRWQLEVAILARLAQLRGGGWTSAPIAAEWTGADEVRCRRALKALDERKVIKRDAGDSGRDHIRWAAVNDDWRRWRVEWSIDPRQIPAQLAHAARQRDESPFVRIFARSYSARSVARIARSYDARSWVLDLEEVAGIARHRSARSSEGVISDRALLIARSLGRRRAPLERAILGVSPQQLTSAGGGRGDDADTRATDADGPQHQQRVIDAEGGWVKSKLLSRSIPPPGRARPFLNGPPLGRLADLLEQHGARAVGAAIDLLPAGEYSALFYVDHLVDLVHELTAGGANLEATLVARGDLGQPGDDRSLRERIVADFQAADATDLGEELARWQDEHEPLALEA